MKYHVPRIFIIPMLFLAFRGSAQYHTYYVSPSGDNANDGLSPASAWQTTAQVSNWDFNPGDSVLFEGGKYFYGTIFLDAQDMGMADLPVVFSSYGSGAAIIEGGESNGIHAVNTGGIKLKNLIFHGDGLPTNNQHGIYFYMDESLNDIDFLMFDQVEVYGFGRSGIMIESNSEKGFRNITMIRCSTHDNGISGIATYASLPVFPHKELHISMCKSYHNYGRSDMDTEATGNGFMISGLNSGIIEYCEAYENGILNNYLFEGSGGIVLKDATKVIVQYCESHHNRSALTADGNGFKLEGGTQNSMIQYSYSHDNDGPGYALHEYGSPNSFVDNVIRYNISQNDARRNRSGAVSIEGYDNMHMITKADIFNNTIYVSSLNVINSTPSAIKLMGPWFNGVRVRSNIFYVTSGNTQVTSTDIVSTTQAAFQYNNYYTESGIPNFNWGPSSYNSMDEWKLSAAGQEKNGTVELGTTTNPLLYNPGGGLTIRPSEGGDLTTVTAYKLQIMSPVINIGMNQPALGNHDYFNNPTPYNAIVDVGAFEYNGEVLLPVHIISLSGNIDHGQSLVQWSVTHQENVSLYVVQRSTDGHNFQDAGSVHAEARSNYNFSETVPGGSGLLYYRLKTVHEDGSLSYSGILRLSVKTENDFSASYVPGNGLQLRLENDREESRMILVMDASGRIVCRSIQQLHKGNNLLIINEGANWPNGIYLVQVNDSRFPVIRFKK